MWELVGLWLHPSHHHTPAERLVENILCLSHRASSYMRLYTLKGDGSERYSGHYIRRQRQKWTNYCLPGHTWTLNKLTAFKMKCFRLFLNVRWFHRTLNNEVWHKGKTADCYAKKKNPESLWSHLQNARTWTHQTRMLAKTEGANKRGCARLNQRMVPEKNVWQTKTIALDNRRTFGGLLY